jgi:hypothetical protein
MIERLYPLSLDHAAQRLEPWVTRDPLPARVRRAPAAPLEPGLARGASDAICSTASSLYGRNGERQRRGASRPTQARAALRANGSRRGDPLESERGARDRARARPDGSELVGVVSLARLVRCSRWSCRTRTPLIALVDGDGHVLVARGPMPGGAPIDRIEVGALHSRGAPARDRTRGAST